MKRNDMQLKITVKHKTASGEQRNNMREYLNEIAELPNDTKMLLDSLLQQAVCSQRMDCKAMISK